MSASFSASAADLAIIAPAAAYSESGIREPAPAPDWIATSAPSAMNFFTVSGVAATRVSTLSASAGTEIFIDRFLEGSGRSDEDKVEEEQDGAYDEHHVFRDA